VTGLLFFFCGLGAAAIAFAAVNASLDGTLHI